MPAVDTPRNLRGNDFRISRCKSISALLEHIKHKYPGSANAFDSESHSADAGKKAPNHLLAVKLKIDNYALLTFIESKAAETLTCKDPEADLTFPKSWLGEGDRSLPIILGHFRKWAAQEQRKANGPCSSDRYALRPRDPANGRVEKVQTREEGAPGTFLELRGGAVAKARSVRQKANIVHEAIDKSESPSDRRFTERARNNTSNLKDTARQKEPSVEPAHEQIVTQKTKTTTSARTGRENGSDRDSRKGARKDSTKKKTRAPREQSGVKDASWFGRLLSR